MSIRQNTFSLRARNPDARHHRRVGHPAADRLDHRDDDGLHAARLRPHTGRDAPAAGRLRAVADTAFHPARRMLRADVLVFHLDQPARGQLLP